MRRLLLLAPLLCGCNPQPAVQVSPAQPVDAECAVRLESAEKRLEELQAQVEALKADVVTLDAARRAALETPQASAKQWIMWESQQGFGNALASAPAPRPVAAYGSQSECFTSGAYNVKRKGGNESTFSWAEQSGVMTWVHTYSCLPESVDPRSKN